MEQITYFLSFLKEYAIKLSGITKKLYLSNLKAMECLMGLERHLGLSELGVQYGCMEAVGVATQILERCGQPCFNFFSLRFHDKTMHA